jgi:hypothetical protein
MRGLHRIVKRQAHRLGETRTGNYPETSVVYAAKSDFKFHTADEKAGLRGVHVRLEQFRSRPTHICSVIRRALQIPVGFLIIYISVRSFDFDKAQNAYIPKSTRWRCNIGIDDLAEEERNRGHV